MKYNTLANISAAIAATVFLLGSPPAMAQQNQTPIPVTDLGIKQINQSSNLKLTATNVNCDVAQTFEFDLDGGAWLVPPASNVIPGLGKGQSGSLMARLDFNNTPPGVYYAHISSHCTSCGWYLLTACVENGEDTVIRVKVVDPSLDPQGVNISEPPNPYANLMPRQTLNINLVPPISSEDFDLLTEKQKEALLKARNDLKIAEAAGKKAQVNLRNARKMKTDCERKLAEMKADAEAADRKAKTAKQDAKNAKGAADKAAKDLANFERDNKKAFKAIDDTMRAVLVASDYRSQVAAKDGTGSGRYKRAQEQVDRFNDEHFEALREYDAVRKSHEQRKKAAEQAAKDAAAEKAKAEQAAADAKAKKAAYDAKLRECLGLGKKQKEAQDAVDDAKSDAEDAVKDSNKAEDKAGKQAIANIPDKIKDLKKKKKKCEEDLKARVKFLKNMVKFMQDMNIINPNKVKQKQVDVEGMMQDFDRNLGMAAAAESIKAFGGQALPTFQVFTVLDSLTIAYEGVSIAQKAFHPGISGYRGTDNLADKLKKDGYAKGADAMKMAMEIENFVDKGKKTAVDGVSKDRELINLAKKCGKIGEEIAKLEAKKAAAKKR